MIANINRFYLYVQDITENPYGPTPRFSKTRCSFDTATKYVFRSLKKKYIVVIYDKN